VATILFRDTILICKSLFFRIRNTIRRLEQ
jgi:hypothetical protein